MMEDWPDIIQIATVSDVLFERGPLSYRGILNITLDHLLFHSSNQRDEFWIPYSIVYKAEWLPNSPKGCTIQVQCRDFVTVSIVILRERDAVLVYQSILKLLPVSLEKLWAFNASLDEANDEGWKLYDPIKEFERMGVGTVTEHWRVSGANISYGLSDTYPRFIAVPSALSDADILQAAKFRSRGRIPILSYIHPLNHAVITRSAQPFSGIMGGGMQKRNEKDEALVSAIFAANSERRAEQNLKNVKNLIIDARPKANAYANAAMGKGFENTDVYNNCIREFLGIDNIHVMRDSLEKLILATRLHNPTVAQWQQALDASGWLKHIKLILDGATRMVRAIHADGCNILVHCSDGWDRTAQLTALAEILLDPYYRTMEGFEVLIEKEWLSVGFKFSDRCGFFVHNADDSLHDEMSPVLIQFIDCVYQLLNQFPEEFEFNELFLIDLHRAIQSCEFGTFLGNCERERVGNSLARRTKSAWTYLNSRKSRYQSARYFTAQLAQNKRAAEKGRLVPKPSDLESSMQAIPPPPKERSLSRQRSEEKQFDKELKIEEVSSSILAQDGRDSLESSSTPTDALSQKEDSSSQSSISSDATTTTTTATAATTTTNHGEEEFVLVEHAEASNLENGVDANPATGTSAAAVPETLEEKLQQALKADMTFSNSSVGETSNTDKQQQTSDKKSTQEAADAADASPPGRKKPVMIVRRPQPPLLPSTNPMKLKFWRRLYCPTEEFLGAQRSILEVEMERFLREMEEQKQQYYQLKKQLETLRAEKEKRMMTPSTATSEGEPAAALAAADSEESATIVTAQDSEETAAELAGQEEELQDDSDLPPSAAAASELEVEAESNGDGDTDMISDSSASAEPKPESVTVPA